jgi:ribonuclease Z
MSTRSFTALGTASQVPTRHRNHNGYLLRWDEVGFLFDPGEGTQRQMIHAGHSMSGVHHICITHFHGDHCLGLPGVLQRASLDGIAHPLNVHYHDSGAAFIQRLRYASIYQERARVVERPFAGPGILERTATWTLSSDELDHGTPSFGYRVEEAAGWTLEPERLAEAGLRGPKIGQLQREGAVEHAGRRWTLAELGRARPGQSVAVVMDTRPCAGAERLAQGVDLLICESTYLSDHQAEARARGHMTARDAALLARAAGARRLVLTHFSQRYPDIAAFVAEAAPIFPEVVAVADGDTIPLRGDRKE